MSAAHPTWPPNYTLSNREREIAGLLADGMTAPRISRLLGITDATVRSHQAHAIEKLGLYSTRHLLAWVRERRAV